MPVKLVSRYAKRLLDVFKDKTWRTGLDQRYKYQSCKNMNGINSTKVGEF